MRIASLLPSATEILCALGAQSEIVGISHECDFPNAVSTLPRITSTEIPHEAPSRAIHDAVVDRVIRGLSLYCVDTEKLAALKPDVIVTQDQCRVCAVSLAEVEQATCHLTNTSTQICSIQPNTIEEVGASFEKVGTFVNREQEAQQLSRNFFHQLSALRTKSMGRSPRVLCVEWLEPLMIAGHWTPQLVEYAGATPLIVTKPGPFATVTWDEVRQAHPEIVIVMPCGFSLERTYREVEAMPRAPWRELSRSTTIYLTDGNAFFNRSGPRLLESAEILSAITQEEPRLIDKHTKNFVRWVPK